MPNDMSSPELNELNGVLGPTGGGRFIEARRLRITGNTAARQIADRFLTENAAVAAREDVGLAALAQTTVEAITRQAGRNHAEAARLLREGIGDAEQLGRAYLAGITNLTAEQRANLEGYVATQFATRIVQEDMAVASGSVEPARIPAWARPVGQEPDWLNPRGLSSREHDILSSAALATAAAAVAPYAREVTKRGLAWLGGVFGFNAGPEANPQPQPEQDSLSEFEQLQEQRLAETDPEKRKELDKALDRMVNRVRKLGFLGRAQIERSIIDRLKANTWDEIVPEINELAETLELEARNNEEYNRRYGGLVEEAVRLEALRLRMIGLRRMGDAERARKLAYPEEFDQAQQTVQRGRILRDINIDPHGYIRQDNNNQAQQPPPPPPPQNQQNAFEAAAGRIEAAVTGLINRIDTLMTGIAAQRAGDPNLQPGVGGLGMMGDENMMESYYKRLGLRQQGDFYDQQRLGQREVALPGRNDYFWTGLNEEQRVALETSIRIHNALAAVMAQGDPMAIFPAATSGERDRVGLLTTLQMETQSKQPVHSEAMSLLALMISDPKWCADHRSSFEMGQGAWRMDIIRAGSERDIERFRLNFTKYLCRQYNVASGNQGWFNGSDPTAMRAELDQLDKRVVRAEQAAWEFIRLTLLPERSASKYYGPYRKDKLGKPLQMIGSTITDVVLLKEKMEGGNWPKNILGAWALAHPRERMDVDCLPDFMMRDMLRMAQFKDEGKTVLEVMCAAAKNYVEGGDFEIRLGDRTYDYIPWTATEGDTPFFWFYLLQMHRAATFFTAIEAGPNNKISWTDLKKAWGHLGLNDTEIQESLGLDTDRKVLRFKLLMVMLTTGKGEYLKANRHNFLPRFFPDIRPIDEVKFRGLIKGFNDSEPGFLPDNFGEIERALT